MNTWTKCKSMVLSEPIYLFMTKIKYIFFHILLLMLLFFFMHSFGVACSVATKTREKLGELEGETIENVMQ